VRFNQSKFLIPEPKTPTTCALLVFLLSTVLTAGCTTAKENENRMTVTPAASAPAKSSSPAKNAAPAAVPALVEVNEAVRRILSDAVEIDTGRIIIGDFNADGSQDLVVVVRPAKGALTKLNSEYANWTIEDPRKIHLPDPNKAVQELPKPPARETIQQNDALLLILHGYREEGWRHPYARQTFLLKKAVGDNMRAEAWSEISKKVGRMNGSDGQSGDVISLKLDGQEGFLYWANGKYVWQSLG
jgi:hypothetical protein